MKFQKLIWLKENNKLLIEFNKMEIKKMRYCWKCKEETEVKNTDDDGNDYCSICGNNYNKELN